FKLPRVKAPSPGTPSGRRGNAKQHNECPSKKSKACRAAHAIEFPAASPACCRTAAAHSFAAVENVEARHTDIPAPLQQLAQQRPHHCSILGGAEPSARPPRPALLLP